MDSYIAMICSRCERDIGAYAEGDDTYMQSSCDLCHEFATLYAHEFDVSLEAIRYDMR